MLGKLRSNLYRRLNRKKGQTREIVSSSSAMRYPASGWWRQVKARATRGRIETINGKIMQPLSPVR
jgi:hypothetical protein